MLKKRPTDTRKFKKQMHSMAQEISHLKHKQEHMVCKVVPEETDCEEDPYCRSMIHFNEAEFE